MNLSGLSGLSAVPGGYTSGLDEMAQANLRRLAAEQLQAQLMGQQARGQAFGQLFGGQLPGAAPLPPQPGQASMPPGGPSQGAIEQPNFQPMPTLPGRGPMMQPQGPGGPVPSPPGAPPGGGPQTGPPGGQQQPLTWQAIVQAVQQANPGAPPQVIAAAVDQFLPVMNQQSKVEWQELRAQIQLELQKMRGDTATQVAGIRGQSAENVAKLRPDTAAMSKFLEENPDATAEQIAAYRKKLRADPSGKTPVGAMLNKFLQEKPDATSEEISEFLKKNDPYLQERTAGRVQRGTQFQQRESRLGDQFKQLQDVRSQRLEFDRQKTLAALDRARTETDRKKQADAVAAHEKAVRAHDSYMRNKIAASSLSGEEKKRLLQQLDEDFRTAQAQWQELSRPSNRGLGDLLRQEGKPTIGAQPAPAPGGDFPPPEAMQHLKEGVPTTFKNGQKWMLQNGKPVQVP